MVPARPGYPMNFDPSLKDILKFIFSKKEISFHFWKCGYLAFFLKSRFLLDKKTCGTSPEKLQKFHKMKKFISVYREKVQNWRRIFFHSSSLKINSLSQRRVFRCIKNNGDHKIWEKDENKTHFYPISCQLVCTFTWHSENTASGKRCYASNNDKKYYSPLF